MVERFPEILISMVSSFRQLLPIFTKSFISIPPENVKKSKIYWRFQGLYKWKIGLKWDN